METAAVVEFLLLLLIAASLIAMATIRLRVPYTIALVIGGFLIDFFHLPIVEHLGEERSGALLTPDIIFMLFLPGLLFEAGLNLNAKLLRRNLAPILVVAIIGVVAATLVTGYAMHTLLGMPLLVALVFGALISATDPISVLALFRELGVTKRLAVLVEGESLFNDGAAVVLFQILVAAVSTGALDFADGLGTFVKVAIGGGAIGLTLGYIVSKLTERVDNPQVEITFTTVLAYGSFLLAEHLHVSGVIATVGAGLMIGNFGAKVGMSSRTRVALWSFWEYLGFVINSLVFLLIGIEVHLFDLLSYWQPIALAIFAVLLGRVVAIYTCVPATNRFTEKIPLAWQHVMTWGGIHGGVSIALALSLRPGFPERDVILAMTFGVVAFSIVVQGLTVPSLMRFLGVEMGREDTYDRAKVSQMAVAAGRKELESLLASHTISRPVYERVREEVDQESRRVADEIKRLQTVDGQWAAEEEKIARARLLMAQKSAIQQSVADGLINQHTAEQLLAQADNVLDELGEVGSH